MESGTAWAVLYDTDAGNLEANPFVVKHGPADLVRQEHRKLWGGLMKGPGNTAEGLRNQNLAMQACDLLNLPRPDADELKALGRQMAAELELVEIPVAQLTDEIVEEINACLACSGRIGRFKERLANMLPAAPALTP